ncbi:MAG TPA: RNA polymerase sigma factor [Pirellulales bacterium]
MSDSSPKLELPRPNPAPRTAVGGGGKGAAGAGQASTAQAGAGQASGAPPAGGARLDITQLVLDHHEVLYRYAYRLTGSVPDAEDLTQQTFLVAHEKLGQVREAECVRGWLFTVLRNAYLKNCRRTVPVAAASLGFDLDTVAAKADDKPLDGEQLQQVLGELAGEFKLVLLLFYFEQRSYREIAEILQVPIGTVMSRLSRAKAHLRSKLFSADSNKSDGGESAGSNTGSGKETIHA